jgi:hypothetical protein
VHFTHHVAVLTIALLEIAIRREASSVRNTFSYESGMTFFAASSRSFLLLEHDLFRNRQPFAIVLEMPAGRARLRKALTTRCPGLSLGRAHEALQGKCHPVLRLPANYLTIQAKPCDRCARGA